MHYTFAVFLLLISTISIADNRLIGTWAFKDDPYSLRYTFSKNNDLTTYRPVLNKSFDVVSKSTKGVWETGSWEIKNNKTNDKRTCSLTIYVSSSVCCFNYKFIATNLIFTNIYSDDSSYPICSNKVLIPYQSEN